jgi:hypothetical protein
VRRLTPSPALLVACLALVMSLGGVSYAATKIGTSDIARDAVTSRKIKDGTVAPVDLSPATRATFGVRGFAAVTVAATFEADRTKGFTSVVRPKKGLYCLTLDDTVDPATTAPVVGVDWDVSSGSNLAAYLSKSAYQCPAGTDLGVRTFAFTAGGDNLPSNTVGFTVLVP